MKSIIYNVIESSTLGATSLIEIKKNEEDYKNLDYLRKNMKGKETK